MRPGVVLVALLAAGCASAPDEGIAWIALFDGPAHAVDGALSIALSPDGTRAYVGGLTHADGDDEDVLVFALDVSDGGRAWERTLDGIGRDDTARVVAVSGDGRRVFATGPSVNAQGRNEYLTLALDAADGHVLWTSRYQRPGGAAATPADLAVAGGEGLVLVTGTSRGADGGMTTVAYDPATGGERWNVTLPLAGAEARAIVGAEGPTSVVIGHGPEGAIAVAYDVATGDERWRLEADEAGPLRTVAMAALSPSGERLYVLGEHASAPYATLVAYDAETGRLLWDAHSPEGVSLSPQALAVSPDDLAVAIAGDSATADGDHEALTMVFDAATGNVEWTAFSVPSPGQEQARAAVFTADARRVLTSVLRVEPSSGTMPLSAHPLLVVHDARDGQVLERVPVDRLGFALELVTTPDGALALGAGSLWSAETRTDASVIAFRLPA